MPAFLVCKYVRENFVLSINYNKLSSADGMENDSVVLSRCYFTLGAFRLY